jgi:hypothetical protein
MQLDATIELVKKEYLVLSLPTHPGLVAFAGTNSHNVHRDPFALFSPDSTVRVTVMAAPATADPDHRLLVRIEVWRYCCGVERRC